MCAWLFDTIDIQWPYVIQFSSEFYINALCTLLGMSTYHWSSRRRLWVPIMQSHSHAATTPCPQPAGHSSTIAPPSAGRSGQTPPPRGHQSASRTSLFIGRLVGRSVERMTRVDASAPTGRCTDNCRTSDACDFAFINSPASSDWSWVVAVISFGARFKLSMRDFTLDWQDYRIEIQFRVLCRIREHRSRRIIPHRNRSHLIQSNHLRTPTTRRTDCPIRMNWRWNSLRMQPTVSSYARSPVVASKSTRLRFGSYCSTVGRIRNKFLR